jgi:thiol-disulfide isomerase/thioredoxin
MIGELALAASVVLAGVFGVAGVAKLKDRAGTRKAVQEFGAPERLVRPVALVLPVAELTVAFALLPASTRVAGAAGALGLLCAFSVAIGVSLVRGRAPNCHCFGQLHSAPTSWMTLVRNGSLTGLAVVSLIGGSRGPDAFGWAGNLQPAEILALLACVVALGLAVGGGIAFVSLLRSYGGVLLRLDTVEGALRAAGLEIPEAEPSLPELGIDPGTWAPAFTVETVSGNSASLADLLEPGLPLLLLFTSPSCGPCRTLLPAFSHWQTEHAQSLTLAVLSGGKPEAVRAEAAEHGLERVLIDHDLAVYDAYQTSGTPGAVLISAAGRIASYVASGAEEIEQLVDRAISADQEPEEDGLPIGTPSPELELLDLDGGRVTLADPDGRETLVLFWNPGCGFCRSMHDDLRAWERSASAGAPRLLVVSSGDGASSRADGFTSTVVLDPDYTAGEAFGAPGTPMAILLDREGRVASRPVAGGAAVLALAAAHTGAGDARVAATS